MNGRYRVIVTGSSMSRLVVWATSFLDAEHKAAQARGIQDPAVTSVAIKCESECVARWRRSMADARMVWVKTWGVDAAVDRRLQDRKAVVAAGCGGGAGSDAIG